MNIQSKLPNIGTTIFTTMSKLSLEHNAINLSQGFPNFEVDKRLLEEYHKVIDEKGNTHQYLPMPGHSALKNEVSKKIKSHYNRQLDSDEEILITAGATQAIFTVIQALVHQGDEVIILDPSYDCYAPSVELSGGKPVHLNLNEDFSVDWNIVNDRITERTRMLIINNPHNPGGKVLSEKDINELELILDYNPHVLLLSDEVYEFIYFEKRHISAHTREKLYNKSIIVSSFGKTFHVTGWKIGYLVAPSFIMSEILKVHQFNVFCVNSISQLVLANYLPTVDLNEISEFYQKKRDLFRALIAGSRFELLDCQGSYFQVAKYNEISSLSDIEFSIEMTKKHGVGVIPISVFNKDKHDNQLIRFCFAKNDETLEQAAERICKI